MSHDVSAFRAPATAGAPYDQVVADAGDTGRPVTGAAKLAQRFQLELMSRAGEVPGLAGGSGFVDRLTSGGVRTETDVFAALAAALVAVTRALRAAETAADPPAERLTGVRVESLELGDGGVTLRLLLTTAAGAAPVDIPLSFILA